MVASNASNAKSIVIFGATGAQGGSVLAHLLKSDQPYRITAVTRDPSKASSKAIAAKGVNVIKAELGDKAQVVDALKQGDLAFAVTNFWEHGAEKEIADGKRLMDAAKEVGTKTLYWSGLMPVSKISSGKYTKVEHFDTKSEILEYGQSIGVPIVDVQPAMYMENFLGQMGPRKVRPSSCLKALPAKMTAHSVSMHLQQEDGSYVFAFPMDVKSKLSLLHSAADYGAFVRGAIESDIPAGGEVLACADELTPVQLAEQWGQGEQQRFPHRQSAFMGKKTSFYPIDAATFASMAGEEITEMVQYFSDFGFFPFTISLNESALGLSFTLDFGGKDVGPSKKVLPADEKVKTWAEFVKASDWSKVLS
ncbi:hypothetical protein QFC22_000612 [Naganishia vaughanmartiniae]|uniref:Uncharacterized protein n=1 Tax=Naganishia vaughanmartiniae TaxID=1424756 RepID=A0ACC2XNP2_9TREE|nr:hypothetical protein QFC22_000612 [Naganishia vaughanmartiniae]